MSLEKVQSGRPMRIKADTFNTMIDATRVVMERSQRSGAGQAKADQQDSDIVLVKNDSGADANRFDVLGIDGPIILPSENLSEFENRVTFSCSTPTAGTHEGKFVVLAEPIKAGAIGKAYAAGIAVAWVYMEHDGQVLTRVVNAVGGGVSSVEEVTGEGYCCIKGDIDHPEISNYDPGWLLANIGEGEWQYSGPGADGTTAIVINLKIVDIADHGGWVDFRLLVSSGGGEWFLNRTSRRTTSSSCINCAAGPFDTLPLIYYEPFPGEPGFWMPDYTKCDDENSVPCIARCKPTNNDDNWIAGKNGSAAVQLSGL